ncbi:syntaxin-8-like isoform X2 [Clavelina lepadiformis]|uniref:t-SNARE coiled-coil homology domain-containing protein n=1 Tax=Clavelina lepadiformis TaxID=159417 RepID=A0ABP0EYH8_CLALP
MPDSWLADYSTCNQLCQDVAELINDRNTDARAGANIAPINGLIKKDLFNLKAIMEKLKFDLLKSSRSHTTTLGEVERRQNLFDTLTTKVRILTDAAECDRHPSGSNMNYSDRTALLSKEENGSTNFGNPWLETNEQISRLTPEQFRLKQEEVIQEQDKGLERISAALSRQKAIGINIGSEAEYQNDLIDDIHSRITLTDSRIKEQTHGVVNVTKKSSTCVLWLIIILLGILIIVIAALPR